MVPVPKVSGTDTHTQKWVGTGTDQSGIGTDQSGTGTDQSDIGTNASSSPDFVPLHC